MVEIRTYKDMIKFETFDERYRYLKLTGTVGSETFGFDRVLNQAFYKNKLWKEIRKEVIARDNGCDLGIPEMEIGERIIVHHMNPITVENLLELSDFLLNPDYLVCVSHQTHNAIHYGDIRLLEEFITERKPNDTKLW